MTTVSVNVTGVLSMDEVVQGDVVLCCPGSSGLYVSVALARLGHPVQFWSRVGEDFDCTLLDELQPDAIHWRLQTVTGPSARLHLVYDARGHIARFGYELGVGRDLDADELHDDFWAAPWVWLGAAPAGYHLEVARRAAGGGQKVLLSPQGDYDGDWVTFSRLLPHLSGLFLNSREAQQLCSESLDGAVARLTEGRPQLLCSITCGERGALLAWGETLFQVGICREPVVNATGAGDTYAAALLHYLLAGRPPEDGLRFAAVAAALSLRGFAYRAIPSHGQVLDEMARRSAPIAVARAPLRSKEAMEWLATEGRGARQDTMVRSLTDRSL